MGVYDFLAIPDNDTIVSNYIAEDEYFNFHKLQNGSKNIIIFVNGFLQQMDKEFIEWIDGHNKKNLNESLFGLSWGSKDLHQITDLILHKFEFNNPWDASIERSIKTGVLLADAISRTKQKEINLAGHSLGCRVIYNALLLLDNKCKTKIKNVILLAGAVEGSNMDNWEKIDNSISGKIFNCYSTHDSVLKHLYKIVQHDVGEPIGLGDISYKSDSIFNINCSSFVNGHMDWKIHYSKVLEQIEITNKRN